jgi:hypothetical protein
MALLNQEFDASQVNPSSSYDALPAGKYPAQIIASEMRVTKDGNGQYLYLEIDILDGMFAGRKLFDRLNLVNRNSDAVQIAERTLSSLCRAVGKLQVKDSTELHLIPFIADVRVRPGKDGYGDSNTIRYLGSSGNAPVTQSQAPASNNAPWKRTA